MKKNIFLIFLLFLFPFFLKAQKSSPYNCVSIPRDTIHYELICSSDDFKIILDSIINLEKTCSNYSDSTYFSLSVNRYTKDDSFWHIIINSNNNISSISVLPNWGFFYHNKHLFVVGGREFCDFLFERTENKKKFPFKAFYTIIDDTFSQWIYIYDQDKNKFYFAGKKLCEGNYEGVIPFS